ncbi:MAG: DUF6077 domain-containing protein [Blautia sp.]|nr:DUF6077 domain-containing protein [Blautia sp.]MDY5031814.1 DUF6077 domain-containing protein [Blautia sp.]
MDFMIKALLILFWMAVIPPLAGGVLLHGRKTYHPVEYVCAGYILIFATTEILALLFLYLDLPLHILSAVTGALSVLYGVAGIIYHFYVKKYYADGNRHDIISCIKKKSVYFWAAVLFIILQLAIAAVYTHFEADDSFYVASATTSVYTDTIFSVDPYTGALYDSLPSRYVLSPFPAFLAILSQLSAGLHPAVIAHTFMPVIFIAMAYMVWHLYAQMLFPQDFQGQGIFLLLCAAAIWFSGYSGYNSGDFMMVRIWQGKGFLAAVMLPFLFYVCKDLFWEEESRFHWIFYFVANTGVCLLSSMAVILVPLLTAVFAVLSVGRFRNVRRLIYGILCTIPEIILGVVFLMIR